MVEDMLDDWVVFGDGNMIQYTQKYLRNIEGVNVWIFKFWLNDELIDMYGLSEGDGDFDRDKCTVKFYPKSIVKILKDVPGKSRVLIKSDYFGDETPLSLESMEKDQELEMYEKLVLGLKTQVARLNQELLEKNNNMELNMANNVRMIRQIQKLSRRGRISDEHEDDDEDYED